MRTQRSAGLCSADCAYRRLYEGSQASLSDMASKQADALNRVARLRSAIVMNLKQSFPVEFGQAEAQLSRRMSTTDDEVLLAYLSGFLALPTRHTAATTPPPGGLADLRDELEAIGVVLPDGSDFTAWAAAVAEFAQAAATRAATAQQMASAAQEQVAEATEPAAPAKKRRRTGAGSLLDGATKTGFAPGDSVATVPPDSTASAHGNEAEASPATPDVPDFAVTGDVDIPWGEEPPAPQGDLTDLFALDPGSDYVPVDVEPVAAEPVAPAEDLGDLFSDEGPLSSLFAEDYTADADSLVDALFAQDGQSEPVGGATLASPAAREPAPVQESAPIHDPEPTAFPMPPTTTGLATTASSAASTLDQLAGPATPAVSPVGRDAGASALRPELFPSTQLPKGKSSRRVSRTSRVSAAPPDPRGLDVPMAQGATGADLTDELFDKLVASVCIPRPVFVSDLVAQVGSKELVSAWEQRCRDMGTASPVRFITPKSRHRERGSLIVPHSPDLRKAASEFTRSWWATCLDERRLRGAKLYEVAVLLHRFGESIISSRIEGDVVVLRVNQARGLVGVVVALDTDLSPTGATRTQVADAVGTLLGDRLTLVAILTYASGGGTLEKLAASVRDEAQTRGWKPTAPVIVSASWDFAADGGASALSVL